MQTRSQQPLLFAATDHGVAVFERRDRRWVQIHGGLDRHHVTSVATDGHDVLAGTRDGAYRSMDFGASWWPAGEGLIERHVRWVAVRASAERRTPADAPSEATPGAFIGTEPAAIYVAEDVQQGWRRCDEVAQLRDRLGWYLPYSPEAGCVRGLAFHGNRGYAAVEQGGLLRSDDGVEHWQLVAGSYGVPRTPTDPTMIHPDVHSVVVHASSPDRVIAPTGGGLYVSDDGGAHWRRLTDRYCRAVWVDPDDADHMVLGPAAGVARDGRIEQSRDGGKTWQPAMDECDAPWPHRMVERFYEIGDELMAVLSDGELITAPLSTLRWHVVLPAVQDVNAIATLGI